ncbi:MAG TPA: YihY/virulence factor BrkB family protein [Chloroflexota bacterium]|nr:YihY/virulence factor BrkB family protein [Chloroflexota bacterium]
MATASAVHDRAAPEPRPDDTAAAANEGGIKGKLNRIRTRLEKYAWFRVAESTAEGFMKDRVPDHAAAMTYYGIFSLFPLILFFLSVAGIILQNNMSVREQLMALITNLLPQGQNELEKVIASVIDAKGAAAGIGLLTLLWSASGWFAVIDSNVNRIWGVSKPRSFIKGKLFAIAMVLTIGGVAVLSWAATAALSLIEAFTAAIPGRVFFWQGVVTAVSILVIAVAFYLLYRYTPRRKIQFGDVWPAALLTAIVWEVTRRIIAFYLTQTDMVSGYGPIGAMMALLFWIYVASVIILVGAELAYAIAKDRRHVEPEEQLEVVAPPGEQPTPKFAPQVGVGHTTGQDQKEPTRPAPGPAQQRARAAEAVAETRGQQGTQGRQEVETRPSQRKSVPQRDGSQHANWQAPASDQPAGWQRVVGSALAAVLGAVVVIRHGPASQRQDRHPAAR